MFVTPVFILIKHVDCKRQTRICKPLLEIRRTTLLLSLLLFHQANSANSLTCSSPRRENKLLHFNDRLFYCIYNNVLFNEHITTVNGCRNVLSRAKATLVRLMCAKEAKQNYRRMWMTKQTRGLWDMKFLLVMLRNPSFLFIFRICRV